MKYVYGIDVGGTTVKIGLFDEVGTLVRKWEIFTNKKENGKYIISDIYESIKSQDISLNDVVGYGFGVPGPVVNNKVIQCVNLGWFDYDLKLEFGSLVGNSNIYIQNDANVAALGEAFKGASKGKKDTVMITLGTGVGGGIISNNNPVDGAFGGGGEIGHIKVIHKNGRACNCGNDGCLETIASATGIRTEYEQLAKVRNMEPQVNSKGIVTAKKVIDLAKEQDSLALEVFDKVTYYIAYACHLLSVTTNPEVIVIGGGVSKAGSFLIEKVRKEFSKYPFIAAKETKIVLASLGNDAGMYGAASLVFND